ncbi:MAG TPA: sporulation protein YabP [Clostridiales bacterium]|nr:sporulation protein YabP [Clostridiales bacterium]
MAIDERKSLSSNIMQNIVLENREKLSISGVLDVLSFDDQIVILETDLGLLTVKGENLKINKLSIDTEEVIVEGEIYNLGYSEKDVEKKGTGFLNKIFK